MESSETLYEQVLATFGEHDAPAAIAAAVRPPRASGAVVPWRRRGDALEVYWVQRAEALRFMGGWHAFPGGGVGRRDVELTVAGEVEGASAAPPTAALPEQVLEGVELAPLLAPGLVAATLRELFEEVGILLTAGGDRPAAAEVEDTRRKLLSGDLDFHDWAAEHDLTLDAAPLTYGGRWLTPPIGPMRFDNRFFLLEWPAARKPQPTIVSGELVGGEWIDPARALEQVEAGDVFVAPPIVHLLRVLSEDGPDAGQERLWLPREANLGPFRRVEFRPGVLLFPLRTPTLPPATHTNAYILGLSDAVLIDPGSPHDAEIDGLAQAVRELAPERRVKAIWLTHHHRDHVGGVERLRAELALPVCAHEETATALRGSGIVIDEMLRDGDRLDLGTVEAPFPVRTIHTPGHARGHLCFYDERFGSLLAGDVVAGYGTIVIDPPGGSMRDYFTTLRELEELAPRALFPGHGPTIRQAVEKLEEYRKHRSWREGRVLEIWREGLRDPAEMVERVYEDLPEVAHPLAVRQIVAHLEHLEQRGEIEA